MLVINIFKNIWGNKKVSLKFRINKSVLLRLNISKLFYYFKRN